MVAIIMMETKVCTLMYFKSFRMGSEIRMYRRKNGCIYVVLWKVLGPERKKVTEGERQLCSEEIHFYTPHQIFE
jgi:hypothetical protein